MTLIIGTPIPYVKNYFRHADCHRMENADMTTPGQRIRQRRIELGYTHQGQFSKLVGCSQPALSEIENGDSKLPSAEVLTLMCEVLETTARWILYGEEGSVSIPTREESALLSDFRSLDPEAREQILSLVSVMKPKTPKK
jgi:transcriptional regulator with XRE-family HTH domain